MFERRLRLFLLFVFILGLVLAVRAAQVQIVDRGHWNDLAASSASSVQYLPAKRGDLLDFQGRVIAHDVTTFDVAVNFCAVPLTPDPDWVKDEATRRAKLTDEYKNAEDADAKALIVAQQTQHVRADLELMWDTISQLTGVPREQIDARRQEITDDVEGKHEAFWRRRYQDAMDAYEHAGTPPWYVRMIAGTPQKPDEETFRHESVVNDQLAFHTIVSDIKPEAYAALALRQDPTQPDTFPQFRDPARRWQSVLTLRPSIHREYPFHEVAAHVIGHVGVVSAEDRDVDPNKDDERRRYALVDRIGRDGLERMAEQQLRGTRGTRVSDRRDGGVEMEESAAGTPVRSTIDMEMQREIQLAFNDVEFLHPEQDPHNKDDRSHLPMNGAAVVIDIKTGQVRALVSVPTFDINQFDQLYPQLVADDLNRPLTNRALLDAREPGSSVKPIIGLGAATQGLISPTDTIHCEGYAFIDGKRVEKPRCWTMSLYHATHQTMAHPHPTGDLTMSDAIERSCNVYFLTLGSRLGIEGESYWMKQFGLGQISGIGLPEARGLVPAQAHIIASDRPSSSWYAAIGQGPVAATPIQICNEMATIARNGIWMRPRLLAELPAPPTTRPDGSLVPDQVDLHLSRDALAAVHLGMDEVVNADAGTGRVLLRNDMHVAAKTGSATAQQMSRPRRNPDGSFAKDADGDVIYDFVPYGHMNRPNPDLPWYYRSGIDDFGHDKGTHSWVAGYAPADNPQIAFAVYVEYGGSGGIGAGSVATRLIDSCIRHGYINLNGAPRGGAVRVATTREDTDATTPDDASRTVPPINTED